MSQTDRYSRFLKASHLRLRTSGGELVRDTVGIAQQGDECTPERYEHDVTFLVLSVRVVVRAVRVPSHCKTLFLLLITSDSSSTFRFRPDYFPSIELYTRTFLVERALRG